MILAFLGCCFRNSADHINISGIILTGNIVPHKKIMDLLEQAKIPVLLAKLDTYSVASRIHDLMIKIRPQDKEKIEAVQKLVKENVDIDKLIERL